MRRKPSPKAPAGKPAQAVVAAALAARARAYAPYSRFKVGAALLGEDGRVFVGCNVENATYGATVCAERNAIAQALVSGCRRFVLLAVATDAVPPVAPCGICRQVLREFAAELPIWLVNPRGQAIRTSLRKLLPVPFDGRKLKAGRSRRKAARRGKGARA